MCPQRTMGAPVLNCLPNHSVLSVLLLWCRRWQQRARPSGSRSQHHLYCHPCHPAVKGAPAQHPWSHTSKYPLQCTTVPARLPLDSSSSSSLTWISLRQIPAQMAALHTHYHKHKGHAPVSRSLLARQANKAMRRLASKVNCYQILRLRWRSGS